MEAALEFEFYNPWNSPSYYTQPFTRGYTDYHNTYYPTLFYDGYDYTKTTYRFRTNYQPIECFGGSVLHFETYYSEEDQSTDHLQKVLLKIKFNLERNSGTGQNVLLVQTYDITNGSITYLDWDNIRHIQYPGGDASTSDYSVSPEPELNTCSNTGANSNFQPASFARINAICNSNSYSSGHFNMRSPGGGNEHGPAWQTVSPNRTIAEAPVKGHVYPDPATNDIRFATSFTITAPGEIHIYNVMGQSMSNVPRRIVANGLGSTVNCDISHLPKGSYWVKAQHQEHVQTFKFIKQ